MSILRPLARTITQPISLLVLLAWLGVMGLLVNRSYLQASSNLATDLARYGSSATWRGVYYRGEKIGFTVSQTVPAGDGFDLEEDGRLQMALLGAATAASIAAARRLRFHAAQLRVLARPGARADRGYRRSTAARP
jgi:hypothetical protein